MVGGVILALIMQRSCKVTYFLSDVARKKQKKHLLIGLGIMGLGIVVIAIGAAMNIPDAIVPIGILVIVGGADHCDSESAGVENQQARGQHDFLDWRMQAGIL
jgi:hypothetical protein